MADSVVVTFQFTAQGQNEVLAALQAIEAKQKEIQGAAGAGGEGAEKGADPGEHVVRAHVEGKEEVEGIGRTAETAEKGFEVLRTGIEGVGRALISGTFHSGEAALASFSRASVNLADHLTGVVSALGPVGAAIGAIVGTAGAAVAGMYEIGERAVETVNDFNELAASAGMTKEQFAAMQLALEGSGVKMDAFHGVIRRVSSRIQAEWGDIQRSVRDSADQQEDAILRISEANRKAEESYLDVGAAERGQRAAGRAVAETREGIGAAERTEHGAEYSLARAQLEFGAKYLNQPITDMDRQRLALLERRAEYENIQGLQDRVAQARRGEGEARDKHQQAIDDETKSRLKSQQAIDDTTEAQINLRKAQNEAQDAELRRPDILARAIQAGTAAQTMPLQQIPAPDIFRGLALMGGGTTAGTLRAFQQFLRMPGMETPEMAGVAQAVGAEFRGREGLAEFIKGMREQNIAPAEGTPAAEAAKAKAGEFEKAEEPAEAARAAAAKSMEKISDAMVRSVSELHFDRVFNSVNAGMANTISSIEKGVEGVGEAFTKAGQGLDAVGSAATRAATALNSLASIKAGPATEAPKTSAEAAPGQAVEAAAQTPYQAGGLVVGPGTDTSDSIPAPWLRGGEYVIRAAQVRRMGVSFLDRMADGGEVGMAGPWLSNGEYVFTPERVQRIGVGVLDALNQGRMAGGGLVGPASAAFVGPGMSSPLTAGLMMGAEGLSPENSQTMLGAGPFSGLMPVGGIWGAIDQAEAPGGSLATVRLAAGGGFGSLAGFVPGISELRVPQATGATTQVGGLEVESDDDKKPIMFAIGGLFDNNKEAHLHLTKDEEGWIGRMHAGTSEDDRHLQTVTGATPDVIASEAQSWTQSHGRNDPDVHFGLASGGLVPLAVSMGIPADLAQSLPDDDLEKRMNEIMMDRQSARSEKHQRDEEAKAKSSSGWTQSLQGLLSQLTTHGPAKPFHPAHLADLPRRLGLAPSHQADHAEQRHERRRPQHHPMETGKETQYFPDVASIPQQVIAGPSAFPNAEAPSPIQAKDARELPKVEYDLPLRTTPTPAQRPEEAIASQATQAAATWQQRGLTYSQAEDEQMSLMFGYNMALGDLTPSVPAAAEPPKPSEEAIKRSEEHPGTLIDVFAFGGPVARVEDIRIARSAYAEGGEVMPDVASFRFPYSTGPLVRTPRYSDGGLSGGAGLHVLDLRTDGGQFQTKATANTIESIRQSALSTRLTQTGVRPSWY